LTLTVALTTGQHNRAACDKTVKINFINTEPVDIIRTVHNIYGPELMKLIFAVLYVFFTFIIVKYLAV